MKALVTGGTGLVGRRLLDHLRDAIVLTRHPSRAARFPGDVRLEQWDSLVGPPAVTSISGADVVFNLAGEPIAGGRWTAEKKARIRDSRIIGTRNLVAGLAAAEPRPKVLISASAIGYYGDRGDEELTEESSGGDDFLAEVCADWEREARAAEDLGMRVVCVRTGVVLARDGGALTKILKPFRLGLGGRLGSGRQWMSWIHIDDLVGILLHASREDGIRGPVNAVSPHPVANAQFTRALGKALGRPSFLPVPRIGLRLALGEMSQILLGSQRVLPAVAGDSGYSFRYVALADALAELLSKSTT